MAVHQVSVKIENSKQKAPKKDVSFRSAGFNPVISLMDGIDKGGFVASILTQDTLGMVLPRTGAALTRNYDQTGKPNYEYTWLVAIREVLGLPSAFGIPFAMLYAIKKRFGSANDVPTSFIKGFSDNFSEFITKNPELLKKPELLESNQALKTAYYKHMVRNLIDSSTEGNFEKQNKTLFEESIDRLTNKLVAIDKETNKKAAKKIQGEFIGEFIELHKRYSKRPASRALKSYITVQNEIAGSLKSGTAVSDTNTLYLKTDISSFVDNLRDYSHDLMGTISAKFKPGGNIKEFVDDFCHKRVGSRFLTNFSMLTAVCLFTTFIPKIYNSVCKGNPELAGLIEEDNSLQPGGLPPILDHKEEGA